MCESAPAAGALARGARTGPAHEDAVPGRVTGVDRGRYTTLVGEGATATSCIAMRARELGRKGIVVGDDVRLVGDTTGADGSLARIVRVSPRVTVLRRTADDTDPVERVLVANADQLVVVSALANPEPRPRLIDRCLVAAYDAGMEPLLVLTKADLTDPAPFLEQYAALSVPHVVTARHDGTTDGLDALREALAGRVSVLVGHSGVGKSTLVNALVPLAPARHRRRQRRHRPRAGTPRRRRSPSRCPTTTAGSSTPPGIRSFGLAHVDPARIIQHFPDLEPGTAQCPRGCTHDEEECALDAWVASGAAGPAGAVAPGLAAPPAAGPHPHDRRLTDRSRRRRGPREVSRGPLRRDRVLRVRRVGGRWSLRLLVDEPGAVLRLAVGVGVQRSRALGPGVGGRGVEVLPAAGGAEAGTQVVEVAESVVVNRLSGSTSDTSTVSTMVRASAKWHADRCAPRAVRRAARAGAPPREQISWAFQQRVWKRHPDGGFAGEGTSPDEDDLLALAAQRRVGHRHGRQQRLGVRVRRAGVDLVLLAQLGHPAEVHDADPVRDVPHDRQVVGDEDVGQAELVLQLLHQVDDLRLHRHVERRDRLVADEHLGVEGDAAGDADALPLAAGELVGVAVDVLGVEPDEVEQLLDPLAAPALGHDVVVDLERLTDDVADRHPGVERGVRVLEDDLDVAAHPAHLAPRRRRSSRRPRR